MDLDKVIAQLEAQDLQKTASAPLSVDARLQSVLAETLEKTAASVAPPTAAEDPVMGLMKMASELAGTEKESELAFANLLGQAFADGSIAKFAAYDAQVKIAMSQQVNEDQDEYLYKSAAEQGYADAVSIMQSNYQDDAVIKTAAEQGYYDATQKIAEAQYEAGYNEQVNQIHKLACGEFFKGAAETEMLLNAVRAGQ